MSKALPGHAHTAHSHDHVQVVFLRTAEGNANRGGVVWHDDGTVKDNAAKEHTMYQRDNVDSALTFKESADTAKASILSTDKAQSQIPVPATGTIPDADQASLAAAQEAGTTASDPATELADAPASDHTAAAQADGNQPSAHAVKGSDSDPQEAVGADAVDTQSNQAGSLTELEAVDLADATNQAAVSQHAGHPQSSSGGTAADAATDGVGSASAVDVQAGASDHAAVDAMDTAPTNEQQSNATGSADTAADTAAASADVPLTTDDSTQQPATDTAAATTAANPTDAAATESAATETSAAATGTSAAATGDTVGGNSWRGTGKGPGLGQSQEFSGGPMNLARPKYRHAPYNLPPARGGERFGLGNTWSPRGRGSPRGGFVSAPGRGFSNPVG